MAERTAPAATAAPTFSMPETAREAGYSYERFRRVWRRLVRALAFPAPVRGDGDGCHYAWDAAAVAAWREGRSRALGPGRPLAPEEPANDVVPSGPAFGVSAQQLNQQRAQLARLMSNGA